MEKVNRGDYCRTKPYCDSNFAVTRQVCWNCDEFCPLFLDVDPRRLHELVWPRISKTGEKMTTLSGKQKQPTPTRQIKAATSQQPPTRQIKTAIGQIKTAPGQEFSTTHFKTCSKCKESKPADLDSFPPCKKTKNGLKSVCRQCVRKYQNEWMRKKRERKQAKQPEGGQAGADITALPAAGKPPASKPKPQQSGQYKSKAVQGPANQPAKNKLALRTNLPKPPRQDPTSQSTQDSASQPTNNKRLVIDFTDHEDILDKIQALARDEIRTPENQILYQLKIASSWYTLSTSSTKKTDIMPVKKTKCSTGCF